MSQLPNPYGASIRLKRPTKEWEDALAGGRTAVLGIPGVVPLEGGLPLLDAEGAIVGGVGVSGALAPQDSRCAGRAAAVALQEAT